MNRITDINDIASLGTILSIWAHPDDETFTAGGLLAQAAANGQRVVCVTATKGEAGVQDEARWPAVRLGDTRVAELAKALDILGLSEHYWLPYHDGQLHTVPASEPIDRLLLLAHDIQPDTIISFPPDGITGHTDHIAVSQWATAVAQQLGRPVRLLQAATSTEQYKQYFAEAHKKFNIYFNIDAPHVVPSNNCAVYINLPSDITEKKIAALRAMPSQYEAFLAAFPAEWLVAAFSVETFIEHNSF